MKTIFLAVLLSVFCACSRPEPYHAPDFGSPPAPVLAPGYSDSVEIGAGLVFSAFAPVHFDFDDASIRPDAMAALDRIIPLLARQPGGIVVNGHCDERGSTIYNLGLGRRRAEAVIAYMTRRGISEERIRWITWGKYAPLCWAADETCWQQNRRVAIRML